MWSVEKSILTCRSSALSKKTSKSKLYKITLTNQKTRNHTWLTIGWIAPLLLNAATSISLLLASHEEGYHSISRDGRGEKWLSSGRKLLFSHFRVPGPSTIWNRHCLAWLLKTVMFHLLNLLQKIYKMITCKCKKITSQKRRTRKYVNWNDRYFRRSLYMIKN